MRWLIGIALLGCALAATGFAGSGAVKVWRYTRLDLQVLAQITDLSVVKEGSDRYYVAGGYTYSLKEKTYHGRGPITGAIYRTQVGAAHALEKTQQADPTISIWIDSKNPKRSACYKLFPTRYLVYAFLLVSLLIYAIVMALVGSFRVGQRG